MKSIVLHRAIPAAAVVAALAGSLAACGGSDDAEQARPNILVLVADDMGYSDIGAFGSEISTPNLDALVREGRVLTRFYTAPACSPTRGMLMSGTDSHRAGVSLLENNTLALLNSKNAPFGVDFGFDNVPEAYAGHMPDNVVTMPQLLKDAGYHTYMAGKWHLAYEFKSTPTPGSYFLPSHYPNKKGFEHSYALLSGAGAHFAPVPGKPLSTYDRVTYTEDDVEFPATSLPANFYSSISYTDKLLSYIERDRADGKPFFAYAAFTAPHWPLQAPDADIAAQKGRYDEGYDVIRARRIARMKQLGIIPANFAENPGLASVAAGGTGKKRWSELTDQEKAVQARTMEVYAAMVSNMDANIGRIVQYLKDKGMYDNTVIFFMSDNGSDSGPAAGAAATAASPLADIGRAGSTYSYGERWAEVSASPFRLWKTFTGAEGSVSVPALIKMPRQRDARPQLQAAVEVKDLLPTFLDLAGVKKPDGSYQGKTIKPITGISVRAALESTSATPPAVRPANSVLALEYLGQGYLIRDGWKLSSVVPPGQAPTSFANVPWQLYNIDSDRGETQNLAGAHPEVVTDLLAQYNRYLADNAVITPARPIAGKRDASAL
ncbi:arylsulfatase [Aquabacterium sp.]|uniref:arylsulfatase n=1 Tax=Aquabacterium sp. TaxID=1872578 RepID=UPI00378323DE